MHLQTFKSKTIEAFVDGNNINVTASPWANLEGLSFMVHGKDRTPVFAGALRWEELDVLLVALNAARAV